MKNKNTNILIESFVAAFFCGIFSLLTTFAMGFYYLQQMPEPQANPFIMFSSQYVLFSLVATTLSVFVPLLIFNFVKMKYLQRKAAHVRTQ